MTRDGRVAAKYDRSNLNNKEGPETQDTLWQDMIQHYYFLINLVVQASIFPCLQVINAEHRVTERFMLVLCQNSDVVPAGREMLWAKGLFFGFKGDFVISTHLLIPQVEHLVRVFIKEFGIKTTTLDSNGIRDREWAGYFT